MMEIIRKKGFFAYVKHSTSKKIDLKIVIKSLSTILTHKK